MGISLANSNYANIENVTVKNCWGDGIYIGSKNNDTGENGCANVKITNCIIDNNRRNGISVINCDNFVIDGCTISNTIGTTPQSGIDIERNYDNEITKGIIKNCTFIDNHFSHILQYDSSNDNTIEDCIFKCKNENGSGDIECYSKKLIVINCLSSPSKRATLITNGGEIDCFNHITVDSNTDSHDSFDAFIYSKDGGTINARNCFAKSHNPKWRGIYLNNGEVNVYKSILPEERYHEKTAVISECNPFTLTTSLTMNAYAFAGDIVVPSSGDITLTLNLAGLSPNTFSLYNKGSGQVTLAGDITDTVQAYSTVTLYWDGNALHKMN